MNRLAAWSLRAVALTLLLFGLCPAVRAADKPDNRSAM